MTAIALGFTISLIDSSNHQNTHVFIYGERPLRIFPP